MAGRLDRNFRLLRFVIRRKQKMAASPR
jgi:hypothetical protein